jgi:hypothetical protein
MRSDRYLALTGRIVDSGETDAESAAAALVLRASA